MTDREKVIKGLECHLKELSVGKACFECPYCGDNPCEIQLITKALAMLKEQDKRINELEEKLRLLEYGDQDILESDLRPAT